MRVTRELSTSLLVAGGLATITLAGCRAEDTVSDRRHDSASLPALIGEHLYTCEDGTQLDGDFMLDGLTLDLTGRGMGLRSNRYSMLVKDGVVKSLNIEAPGKFEVSDAGTLLAQARTL